MFVLFYIFYLQVRYKMVIVLWKVLSFCCFIIWNSEPRFLYIANAKFVAAISKDVRSIERYYE